MAVFLPEAARRPKIKTRGMDMGKQKKKEKSTRKKTKKGKENRKTKKKRKVAAEAVQKKKSARDGMVAPGDNPGFSPLRALRLDPFPSIQKKWKKEARGMGLSDKKHEPL